MSVLAGDAAPFEAFPSIPRLFRECWITEKLDGTNAQVYVSESGVVLAGSRSRWITPENDNHGFARWVVDHEDELRQFGPGRHFGEWWGSGIQRGYGLKEKRFSLFNTGRWGVERDHVKHPVDRPACCDVVPVLYRGAFLTTVADNVLARLDREGSTAAPGFMKPEGIVVYLPAAHQTFKVTLGGDGHKTAKPAEVAL
jgi:hypothetical protein